MIARRDDAMPYYIREQGLGMAEALPTVTYKKCDTIKTLALFRNELQGASPVHSYWMHFIFLEKDKCTLRLPNSGLILFFDSTKLD